MTRSRSFLRWILPSLLLLALAWFVYTGMRKRNQWKKDHMLVELRAIQTPKGWGYDILTDGKVFVHQNIIPAIPGEYGFRTKEDALAVGKKVYDRVMAGQIPMVSAEEIKSLGVYPDTTAH
jgi:hypothetical protein